MSDERAPDFLHDIREAAHRIITYTDTMTSDIFLHEDEESHHHECS